MAVTAEQEASDEQSQQQGRQQRCQRRSVQSHSASPRSGLRALCHRFAPAAVQRRTIPTIYEAKSIDLSNIINSSNLHRLK